jgi:hypothetical protein
MNTLPLKDKTILNGVKNKKKMEKRVMIESVAFDFNFRKINLSLHAIKIVQKVRKK